jgi:hypothetical protein
MTAERGDPPGRGTLPLSGSLAGRAYGTCQRFQTRTALAYRTRSRPAGEAPAVTSPMTDCECGQLVTGCAGNVRCPRCNTFRLQTKYIRLELSECRPILAGHAAKVLGRRQAHRV